MTLPNALSILRLALAPVLLVLAWLGAEQAFLVVLAMAYITDAVDGPIARRIRQETRLGPKLDTWADVTIYLSAPLGAWWLWPDLIRRELIYFTMVIASIVLPTLAGLIKFRATNSYHTWLVKIAAICTTISSLLLFLQFTPLPFRVAAVLCVL
ncbi:MAG: CDP-alcohol phosphatidyltransferase, partial [Gammaproteobacteria bacterium]|nr:CDP-alcohol phosphatidyltransferase [Gammaproteobacteria bacterium]